MDNYKRMAAICDQYQKKLNALTDKYTKLKSFTAQLIWLYGPNEEKMSVNNRLLFEDYDSLLNWIEEIYKNETVTTLQSDTGSVQRDTNNS